METATREIEIGPLRGSEDEAAFRSLNEEWIERHFVLEAKDREVLGHPRECILDKGGRILMVHRDGVPVGCVALIPIGGGTFELSKMAVSPELRGRGIGRQLLEYAIQEARGMGAERLFLGSSTKLKNAVHLYEALGFAHVPPERIPKMEYTRADVFMEMRLSG